MPWPKVDPELRKQGFALLRRMQVLRESKMTSVERIEQADRLMDFARSLADPKIVERSATDEPLELMLRMGGRRPRPPA